MASRYEVEVTITSARDLKNVNWRYGDLRPYAVLWVDPASKCSAKVDVEGGMNPVWDEKLRTPLPYGCRVEDSTIFIDIIHAKVDEEEDTKPLIGSAHLPLLEVLDEVGIGGKYTRSLQLKRPSGRPQGKLEVKVAVKEPSRYYDSYALPYGQTASGGSRDHPAPPPPYGGYGQPYTAAVPPAGYPYGAPQAYGAPPAYGAPQAYGGAPPPTYGQPPYGSEGYGAPPLVVEEKKSKFKMGTGLAVGAAAGVLGGLALAEGIDYVEDKIEDNVAERVEDDLAYDGYDDF